MKLTVMQTHFIHWLRQRMLIDLFYGLLIATGCFLLFLLNYNWSIESFQDLLASSATAFDSDPGKRITVFVYGLLFLVFGSFIFSVFTERVRRVAVQG